MQIWILQLIVMNKMSPVIHDGFIQREIWNKAMSSSATIRQTWGGTLVSVIGGDLNNQYINDSLLALPFIQRIPQIALVCMCVWVASLMKYRKQDSISPHTGFHCNLNNNNNTNTNINNINNINNNNNNNKSILLLLLLLIIIMIIIIIINQY